MHDHEMSVTAQSVFANLSVTQIHYLDAIRHLGSPTIGELARHHHVANPTSTVVLEKLEREGYITKIHSSADRRVSHVHLTKKGMKISDLHDEIHKGYADLFTAALARTELEQLVKHLNKVIAHIGL